MRETVTETTKAIKGLRSYVAAVSVTLVALLGVLGTGASAASAAELECKTCSPWWHVTTNSRPAYLTEGARVAAVPAVPGAPEVQEISFTLNGEGAAFAVISAGSVGLGEFYTNEEVAKDDEFHVLNAQGLREALEGTYGAGKVQVTEKTVAGVLSFKVMSEPTTKPIEVAACGCGESAKVLSPGTAGTPEVPAVPDGELYATAENLGDADVDGTSAPVTFRDVIPSGLKAIGVGATKPHKEGDFQEREPLPCSLSEEGGVQVATCTLSEKLAPYDQIEMRVGVDVEPAAHTGEENQVSISGGGAPAKSAMDQITVSSAPVPFGIARNEMDLEEDGGAPTVQAGAHPFQLTSTIVFNQLRDINPLRNSKERPEVNTPLLAKDINVKLPPGLVGNPTPLAQCTTAQFFQTDFSEDAEESNACPPDSAVGVATVTVHEPATVGTAILTEPIFNLEPRAGEPARFGFYVILANSPVFIDTSVRTGDDYGITVSSTNITQIQSFLSGEFTFWGVPGDPRHDNQRSWGCLFEARDFNPHLPCAPSEAQHPPPFLSMPTRCDAPLQTSITFDSWQEPANVLLSDGIFEPSEALGGCNRLQFQPQIKVKPDAQESSKPTGLTVDVHVPQEINDNAAGDASSDVKDIAVALPAGVAVNPSSADGLEACSEGLVGFTGLNALDPVGEPGNLSATFAATPKPPYETPQPGSNTCGDGSKIGEVSIHSPLLPATQPVNGSVYLASQEANPFGSLLAMYIVATDPVSGTLVKLAGEVQLCQAPGQVIDGMTCQGLGQIITLFKNNPQLAFEDAEFHFFGGERAPLASPTRCGTYTTEALFTPWSTPPGGASSSSSLRSSSSFEVNSGPDHSACTYPGQALPFHPTLTGGATNIQAGAFSPFTLTMSRLPGEQNLQSVEAHLPPGLSGILSNIELCPEPQANQGACGPNSLIGETTVSVGVGGSPFAVHGGKFYLTGPYNGASGCAVGTAGCAPFGITFEVPAKAGPFDFAKTARNHPACDCVLVRGKIEIDPHTAAITIVSNPPGTPDSIPTQLEGVPLEIQHVNAITTRSNFQFNPTNCSKLAVSGTIHSSEGGVDTINVPLQITNCAALKFAPKFSVSTKGANSKAKGATLTAKLTYPKAPQGTYANITRVKVDLPKQLPSRLTTLQKACTNAQFELNPANCPKESKIGFAKVTTPLLPVPLEGPAIFVSHGGEAFPSLTMVLQGAPPYAVTVDLVGTTFISSKGITSTTFKTVPDVPFNTFTLTLPQNKFSALAANVPAKAHYSLCGQKLIMPTEFVAQNGTKLNQSTKIAVTGCKAVKKKKPAKRKKGKK